MSIESSSSSCKIKVLRIKNYAIQRELAPSRFGSISLAVDYEQNRAVVIKTLEKARFEADDFGQFVKQLQILTLLKHRNLVPILDIVETQKNVYIIQEYVEGPTLLQYVAEKSPNEADIKKIFGELAGVLTYCHLRKLTHRDLKLESIIMSGTTPRIVDFGFSQALSSELFTSAMQYMAPEILGSEKVAKIDKVDFYALGVCLFYAFNKAFPFAENSFQKPFAYYNNSKLSAEANEALAGLLKEDPKQRWGGYALKTSAFFKHTFAAAEKPKISDSIDFRVIYTMASQISYWKAPRVIQTLNKNRFNHISASYHLLCEKYNSENDFEWNFDEQARYAKEVGIILEKDGNIRVVY